MNNKIILLWPLIVILSKDNKFTTAMVKEIIVFYCHGMALRLKITNTIVFHLEYGMIALKDKQDNIFIVLLRHKRRLVKGYTYLM